MGTYYEPVVELDEGPYPIIDPDAEGFYLSWQLDVTDLRTRAVLALIQEAPRRVWWVADDTPFYYTLTDHWRQRLGPGYDATSTIPEGIADSTMSYPVVVNVDKDEFFVAAQWDGCPLPVLAASHLPRVLPDGWAALCGRWHGDRITVRAAQPCGLVELRPEGAHTNSAITSGSEETGC
ncbi:hypothetical protein [Mycobacterium servetii]|uniref:Uncharacterized protein n=1 Tax=Mycobacterium servetii TaxID=3237418 RepID=A0ABV4CAZ5_9MYCO